MNRFAVCLSLAATAAFAEPDEWRVLLEQGEQFRHAGRHQDAAEAFRGAARLLERSGPPDMRLGSALNSLAIEYDDLARYPDAEANYRRALGIVERVRGKDNGDYGQTLANLGAVYSTMGRTTRGERMMTEAIAIFDALAPADGRAAVCRNMLAQSMLRARRLTEAEPLLEQARRTLAAMPLPDSGRLAAVLNNLGMVRRFQGRHDEAITFLQQSIARLEAEFGPDHRCWRARSTTQPRNMHVPAARRTPTPPTAARWPSRNAHLAPSIRCSDTCSPTTPVCCATPAASRRASV